MKKCLPLILFFIFVGLVYAEEKIAITMKSGVTYHWDNYYEKDNSYCTIKYGEFCIQKNNIASIIKGDVEKLPPVKTVDPNDSRVIQRNKKWSAENEARMLAIQIKKQEEINRKYEQEKLIRDILHDSIEVEGQLTEMKRKAGEDEIKKAKRRNYEENTHHNNVGAINVTTGEYLAPSGSGYIGTRDGTYYAPAGPNGIINTRTGEFSPLH